MDMRVLVVGGGGREHAIIKKIAENPKVAEIFALPGNGGISKDAVCIDISAEDPSAITNFAKENKIDFAVVAPDDPLVMGCVDMLESEGISCFGPNKDAALIEGSKAFSKELMKKYGIPTAEYRIFDDKKAALDYIDGCKIPAVIKADGLAKGKGVIIAETRKDAHKAVCDIMEDRIFGESGSRIVIEEFLEGPEVSVLSFTDGKTLIPMISSMDHKRALDGDKGLNTGGMGAVAPNPYYTDEIAAVCEKEIFLPTMTAMNKEGRTFKGCLYFGLMITKDGPKVIEYNCRFGDPETQVVLPLLESDLLDIMMHVSAGTLSEANIQFSTDAACCIVMASKGYPQEYRKGHKLTVPENLPYVYIAGANYVGDELLSSGGRVLGVTERGRTIKKAIDKAYASIRKIEFNNGFYRKDIGQRALRASEEV